MNPTDPLAQMLQAWPSLTGAGTPVDALIVQAHVASSSSLVRAGQRGSESWLQYLKEAPAEAPLAARVDAARGHLRRLAETAADEARQVAQQLAALDEQARALVAPAAPDAAAAPAHAEGDPVRRARAKP
jgi:hypothetical protein